MKYKYIRETFVLMDNKHRKLFVIKQTKRCLKIRLAAGPAALMHSSEGRGGGLLIRGEKDGERAYF